MNARITLLIAEAINADRWIASEAHLQECTAKLLDRLGLLWCHVPNGGLRNKKVGGMLKKHGAKAGVPDILIFGTCVDINVATGTFKGCAIELKSKKGRLQPTQREWLENLSEAGWYTDLAYSMKDIVAILEHCGYIGMKGVE